MNKKIHYAITPRITTWFVSIAILLAGFIFSPVYAQTADVTTEGNSEYCYSTRDLALKSARDSAEAAASTQCFSQSGWKYGGVKSSGYEQCKPCANPGEFKCFVTQAIHYCTTYN
jgi:hypothetical protein